MSPVRKDERRQLIVGKQPLFKLRILVRDQKEGTTKIIKPFKYNLSDLSGGFMLFFIYFHPYLGK